MRLPPFALERYFARHEFTTELLLCSSDCESLSVRELLSCEPGAEERFRELRLGYTESSGSPALRREISALYQTVPPDGVLVTTGAEEAVFLVMNAMLGPGDHAVVHWPCYQSLFEVARAAGADVTRWTAREEEDWALDPAELPSLLRETTRMIVINSPHNPTGYHMRLETLREISEAAEERGTLLFSDEVYRGAEYAAGDRLPAACDLSASAVSLGVMSKTYGLPGLRIGWIATRNPAVLSRVAELKDYTTICSSGPAELLAEIALRHGEDIASRNRSIIRTNLSLLDGFFRRRSRVVRWRRPAAGPIGFPRLLQGDSAAFCSELAAKAGVLLLPGSVYGDAEDHFRIGFGRANMPEALRRLEEFLDAG